MQNQIENIRDSVKGLECRTEAELDARIRTEEDKIRFGTVTLREERAVVAEISKLKSQRDKIRAYEAQKTSLAGLQSEVVNVRAVIGEMDTEVGRRIVRHCGAGAAWLVCGWGRQVR